MPAEHTAFHCSLYTAYFPAINCAHCATLRYAFFAAQCATLYFSDCATVCCPHITAECAAYCAPHPTAQFCAICTAFEITFCAAQRSSFLPAVIGPNNPAHLMPNFVPERAADDAS